jgi:hypothetical protein
VEAGGRRRRGHGSCAPARGVSARTVMDPALRAAAEAARGFMPPDGPATFCGRSGDLMVLVEIGTLRQVGCVPRRAADRAGLALDPAGRETSPAGVARARSRRPRQPHRHAPPPAHGVRCGSRGHGRRSGGRLTGGRCALGVPLAFLFIDGGHGSGLRRDYRLDASRPAGRGARHPRRVWDTADGAAALRAVLPRSGRAFRELSAAGSLRVLTASLRLLIARVAGRVASGTAVIFAMTKLPVHQRLTA